MYANARSIVKPGKMDELRCLIHTIPHKVHVILITETWIKSEAEAENLKIPGYTHYYNYRCDNRRGGGVSIFVQNDLKHHYIEELCVNNESHFIWIHLEKLSLDIGVVYKPDTANNQEFLENYTQQLLKRKRAIVFGDFNYDLLIRNQSTTAYKQTVRENGYRILNKIDPNYCTRETANTRTILDHVSTNILNNSFHLVIVDSAMSDHKELILEVDRIICEKPRKVKYTAVDYNQLFKTMEELSQTEIINEYEDLEKNILEAVRKHTVTKTKILNPPKCDWINKEIIESIQRRNLLAYKSLRSPNDETARSEYLHQRKLVRAKIQTAKNNYYQKLFMNCVGKSLKMWQLINDLTFNKVKTNCAPSMLSTNVGDVTEVRDICEIFNAFFANVGSSLANEIPLKYRIDPPITQVCGPAVCSAEMIDFTPVTTTEIGNIINNLSSNTSSGLDGISCKVVKCLKRVILNQLTICINKCLINGKFPDSLKIAKVTPVYKSGSKSDTGNYRPISVLPIFSKIIEKVIYNRLEVFLTSNKLLFEKQYGFRPGASTLSASIDLITYLKNNIDQKKVALGVFIDLRKAFDTISHKLLLQKLQNMGIGGSVLKMLESYLTNRYQSVKIGNSQSEFKQISYGVPQGSILGPLLFLTYINNICQIGLKGDISLYADDTCLFYFGSEIGALIEQAQSDLDALGNWFQYNLLTVNAAKTNYMVFHAKNKNIPDFPPLSVNNEQLSRIYSEKYLGLVLDTQLTWKNHIEKIRSRLSSLMAVLRGNVRCFPKSVRYTIYNTLVKSHLDYLIEVWGCAAKSKISSLQRAQNKIVKLLFHYDYLTPTSRIYKETGIMTISQTYKYKTCILIRKILNNKIITKIKFTKRHEIQSRVSRRANNIILQMHRTNYGKKNIMYEGAQLYNKLPNHLKQIKSFSLYKTKLKKHILSDHSEFK